MSRDVVWDLVHPAVLEKITVLNGGGSSDCMRRVAEVDDDESNADIITAIEMRDARFGFIAILIFVGLR